MHRKRNRHIAGTWLFPGGTCYETAKSWLTPIVRTNDAEADCMHDESIKAYDWIYLS